VADPFLVQEGDRYYLFFEYMNTASSRGEIGVAESSNGYDWRFTGVALTEPFHLSYPYVFKHNGAYYMIPESRAANGVRLYRAKEFPLRWELQQTLFEGPYADPSIVYHANRWWIFAEKRSYTLSLWSADTLEGKWSEHPKSPLYVEDKSRGRPGGRIIDLGAGENTKNDPFEMVFRAGIGRHTTKADRIRVAPRLIRFSQDNVGGYGKRVRAFQITKLSPDSFKEQVLNPDPLLEPGGTAWRFNGMHHLSPVRRKGGGWIAAVDGNGVPEADESSTP
jgi:hypothetical protein